MLRISLAVSTSLLLSSLALAQDRAAPADAAAGGAWVTQLRAALVKMAALDSVAFRSLETAESALTRQMAGFTPPDIVVEGRQSGEHVLAALNDGDDEVVLAGTGMVARADGGAWKRRRHCLADGSKLPFVVEPRLLFGALANMGDEALHVLQAEEVEAKGRKVMRYTVTLDGEAGRELSLTGGIPGLSGMGGFMVFAGGGGGRAPGSPEMRCDLAIDVAPESNLVLRLHAKGYQESALPGNVMIRMQGADGEEVEIGADDAGEAEDTGELRIVRGLPKRKIGQNTSLLDFDVTFKDHGEAAAIELDAVAKRALGTR